jgi:hypothetical protein
MGPAKLAPNVVQRLTGEWRLAPDPDNRGREERWFESIRPDARPAPVPGIIQQVLPDYHGVAWYWRRFRPARGAATHERGLLRFGAVDYLAEVWLNGVPVGGHEGGETPFVLDVTAALRPDSDNLLAVRVLNPTDDPIDGIRLAETPHRNKRHKDYQPGSSLNHGGIMLPVEFVVVPAVRITDLFVRPQTDTGRIDVSVTVRNDEARHLSGGLRASVGPETTGDELDVAAVSAEFAPGESVHELTLHVTQPRLWNLDDPYLYRVSVALEAGGGTYHHTQAVRCGFRDFRVTGGYFRLNGKRIFLRSTHTGNHFPIGQQLAVDPDLLRRDLILAKVSGFNTVRFIAGVAYPEQLDFCDEIGLMVYEECYAAWCLEDSPHMAERFDRSTREMILRDRNHPSVTIWGMLNETPDGPVFRRAVDALTWVRALDEARLVLLNSGRWDCQAGIGSFSNPGRRDWEHQWGTESPGAPAVPSGWTPDRGGYVGGMGDAHVYPRVPHPPHTLRFLRTLGADTKPVFLSEYGIGSLLDVVRGLRKFEEAGAAPDLDDAVLFRSMAERLEADWQRFGMDGVYPSAADMLQDSQRLHVRQRLVGFDLVRSNPNLCGFNVTGMLDHGITGEGLWTFWREWKPGIADALADGWAPLRWCLFVDPLHGYAGRPITLEAVLANEDVLAPGEYPVRFRVSGPAGVAWEENATARIPEPGPSGDGPLAVGVLRATVNLTGPAGEYIFSAEMLRGGAPAGGRLKFRLSDAAALPRMKGAVTLWGLDDRVEAWLTAHGLRCRRFEERAPRRREVILVGNPGDASPGRWRQLARRIAKGSTAVFLSPAAFKRGEDPVFWLPLEKKGRCYEFSDWLYHKECVAKAHPIFDGLQSRGILDWDYYDQIIPHGLFDGQDTPEDVAVAAFAAGYSRPGGYASGVLVGAYNFGAGRFVLNTLRVLDYLDAHPAADRLLLNFVRYAQSQTGAPPADLPADFDARLKAIGYRT